MKLEDPQYQNDLTFLGKGRPIEQEEIENAEKERASVENFREYEKRKEANGTFRLPNPLSFIFILSGSLLIFITLMLLLGNASHVFNPALESDAILAIVISLIGGIVILILGIIARIKALKRTKRSSIRIVTEEDFAFSEEAKTKPEEIVLTQENSIHTANTTPKFVSPLADLEDEEEALSNHREVKKKNYDFFALDFPGLVKRFDLVAKGVSFSVEKGDAINFLAHLDSTRLFLFKDFSSFSRQQLPYALSKTFHAKTYFSEAAGFHSVDDLLNDKHFTEALTVAAEDDDSFVFYIANNLPSARISAVLGTFLEALIDRNNRHKVRAGKEQNTYTITPNLVFLFLLPEKKGDEGYYLEPSMFPYAAILPFRAKISLEPVKEKLKEETIRLSDYLQIVAIAKRSHPLSEDIWQKIDSLSNYVSENSETPYVMENDVANALENHASLSLAYPESEQRVVDEILSVDLLPNILSLLPKEKIQGEDGLEGFLHREFMASYNLEDTSLLLPQALSALNNPWKEKKNETSDKVETPSVPTTPAPEATPEVVRTFEEEKPSEEEKSFEEETLVEEEKTAEVETPTEEEKQAEEGKQPEANAEEAPEEKPEDTDTASEKDIDMEHPFDNLFSSTDEEDTTEGDK